MHSPTTKKGSTESEAQLRQSVAVGPLHVAQDGEHGVHELLALGYLPSGVHKSTHCPPLR